MQEHMRDMWVALMHDGWQVRSHCWLQAASLHTVSTWGLSLSAVAGLAEAAERAPSHARQRLKATTRSSL